MAALRLDDELAALESLELPDLRKKWTSISDAPAPRVSAGLLRYAIAYELQVAEFGGLPRKISQKLAQLAGGMTTSRDPQPGMRLVREWNGTLHVVTVDEDGAIVWNEKTWTSLSSVARAITGTRWSGPAFFGLKQKKAAA